MSNHIKTDKDWKELLNDESYRVTRQSGTERPFTGKYWNFNAKGVYKCICCGESLFESETKDNKGNIAKQRSRIEQIRIASDAGTSLLLMRG